MIFVSRIYAEIMQPFYDQFIHSQINWFYRAKQLAFCIAYIPLGKLNNPESLSQMTQAKEKVSKNLLDQFFLLNLCVQPCVGKSQHNHILGRPSFLLFHFGEVPHSKNIGRRNVEQNKSYNVAHKNKSVFQIEQEHAKVLVCINKYCLNSKWHLKCSHVEHNAWELTTSHFESCLIQIIPQSVHDQRWNCWHP